MNVPSYSLRLLSALWPTHLQRLPLSATGVSANPDDRTVFLHYGDTPTLDYYWKVRFPNALFIDTSRAFVDVAAFDEASMVILIRHVGRDWLRLLKKKSNILPPTILFLDDDIPGILTDHYLPLKYALKTAVRYGTSLDVFNEINAEVRVATPGLAERYGLPKQSIVPPLPLLPYFPESTRNSRGPATVFYHGTASHMREIRWLRDVAEGVVGRLPDVVFEVFGNRKVSRLYQGVKGVRVVSPMPWNSFFEYTSFVNYDIGLAPLLKSPFNQCRSHVKYFDITRTGGVGIYSDDSVFRPTIQNGVNGVLVENTKQHWIDAICLLAQDAELRCQLFDNAAAKVLSLGTAGKGGQ